MVLVTMHILLEGVVLILLVIKQVNSISTPVWGSWGPCSKTCGRGIHIRTGTYKGSTFKDVPRGCIGLDCNDEKLSQWSSWSKCPVTCGGGIRMRRRTCTQNGGKPCSAPTSEGQPCGSKKCPIDAKFKPWTSWSECSMSCGTGARTRTRICTPRQCGGKPCIGPKSEIQLCSSKNCPVDGECEGWAQWSRCPVTCGHGVRKRMRTCTPPRFGGKSCSCPTSESQICSSRKCPQAPLTSDACLKCTNTDNNIGYLHDPYYCAKYYVCVGTGSNSFTIIHKTCPAGTMWNDAILSCVKPSAAPKRCGGKESVCNIGRAYYADVTNCAAFYQCAPGGARRMCCPVGTRWLQKKSVCGHNTNGVCKQNCIKHISPSPTSDPCPGIDSTCDKGYTFHSGRCKCIPVPSGGCISKQVLYIPCSDAGDAFPKDHSCHKAYIANIGHVTRTQYSGGKVGDGCQFSRNRGTKLEIPFFNNWFDGVYHFSVVFWFKTTLTGRVGLTQSLLHNGCKDKPSITIYLIGQINGSWRLRAKINDVTVGIVEVGSYQWVHTALVYTGRKATLCIWSPTMKQNIQNPRISGPIRNTRCPLTIGKQGSTPGFNGNIDEVRVYKHSLTAPQVAKLRITNQEPET